MSAKSSLPSRFTLKGFTHEQGFRQFAFEGVEEDRVRTQFTVCADLTLARAYGIHIQDLPLLCRDLLERRAASGDERMLTFAEEDMRILQAARVAAKADAAHKRRTPLRKVSVDNTGNAWRTTPLGIRTGS